jgi:hypothetical protein
MRYKKFFKNIHIKIIEIIARLLQFAIVKVDVSFMIEDFINSKCIL